MKSGRAASLIAVLWLAGHVLVQCTTASGAHTVRSPTGREFSVPANRGRITDLIGLFHPAEKRRFENKLAAVQGQTGSQVLVLCIETTGGIPIHEYSRGVIYAWDMRSDGILFTIVKADRNLRLDIGSGLNDTLPLARVQVIVQAMISKFNDGDFFGGMNSGIDAVAGALRAGRR